MQSIFGCKVRKIAVNASLGCPNMDAASGMKGCTYCNNASFSPNYTKGDIRIQIEKGKEFSKMKGENEGYLAYFQSFTGTYGPTGKLVQLYEEVLETPGVKGLVIATRPDCLADDLMEYFRCRFGNGSPANHPYLLVEIGVESTNDSTLKKVNRGHSWECAKNAIIKLDGIGIDVGAHLIIGLPGETEEDYVRHMERISELPVKTLKLHQLQIIRGTAMARQYTAHPEEFHLFTAEEYARTVNMLLKHIRPDIALDRFVSEAPKGMVIAPSWGLKPSEFVELLEKQRCDVLVFGSMGDIARTVEQALEARGLRVHAVPFPQNTCRDKAGYERELLRAIREYEPRMVMPVGNTQTLAELADVGKQPDGTQVAARKLPEGTIAAVGREEHIALLDSKITVYELAESLGLPLPRRYAAPDEVIAYPVIFKRDKSFGGTGVLKPGTSEALEHAIDHEKGKPYLIEEYIEGTDYSVDCIIDGERFEYGCYRCLSNNGQGPSIDRECVTFPQLGEYARRILETIGYKGVCGMDFRVDRSGNAYFLECNPRFTGGLKTQIEAGFDLPWKLYQMFSK